MGANQGTQELWGRWYVCYFIVAEKVQRDKGGKGIIGDVDSSVNLQPIN